MHIGFHFVEAFTTYGDARHSTCALSFPTMTATAFSLTPQVFTDTQRASVFGCVVNLAQFRPSHIESLLDSATDNILGVAPHYGKKQVLARIAFASRTHVLVVNLDGSPLQKQVARRTLEPLLGSDIKKAALRMDAVVAAFSLDLRLLLDGGIDLLSMSPTHERESMEAVFTMLGELSHGQVNKAKANALFKLGEGSKQTTTEQLAQRAWVARRVATWPNAQIACPINASSIPRQQLAVLSKLVRDVQRLSALKPSTTKNEVDPSFDIRGKDLRLKSSRYKTRLQSHNPEVIIEQGKKKISGHIKATQGKRSRIGCNAKALQAAEGPLTVTTIGKELPTIAEAQRADIVLAALKQTNSITSKSFFRAIWLDGGGPKPKFDSKKKSKGKATLALTAPTAPPIIVFPRPLNTSQKAAVHAILSPEPTTVIQGPPGTGKTTVIAAAVMNRPNPRATTTGGGMYLVAQSNVAVKNIAEKLASVEFLNFRIFVSKDFHFEWHEHLYKKIEPLLVRSDKMPDNPVGMQQLLAGATTILCTLSMLSNSRFGLVTRVVPVETMVVDEASQIEIGDYVSPISLFSTRLTKMVFIGDDKQLPPYGQSDVSTLQSVFEVKHLREQALFLDTQCKPVGAKKTMPTQLGDFIGRNVYGGRLKSVHVITSRCWQFVDVPLGKEERDGNSWFNIAEIQAIMKEAHRLTRLRKSFRIITPYDPQRGLLEKALKAEKLDADDKVFCVDSFQGNEDDYILLSLVRTSNIGFMNEERRVNVMLTRCKVGMKIYSSREFVLGKAKKTLIGKLARSMGEDVWMPFE
ncbi:AAA-12 domain-containing protein [Mycena chlorophos]|uniref:AAA-12 domain-containing protein n=1 Tax=Mycena chlorophos TaxID=658473 RepID=A0A8H6WLF2_MYCCL|nr:AAA-12 domain-containing protein [Mycena chlorophos]